MKYTFEICYKIDKTHKPKYYPEYDIRKNIPLKILCGQSMFDKTTAYFIDLKTIRSIKRYTKYHQSFYYYNNFNFNIVSK